MEVLRIVYKILAGKPEDETQLVRRRCRSEDNIRMDLREMWEGVDLIHQFQGRD
jgi:hypothetical protein